MGEVEHAWSLPAGASCGNVIRASLPSTTISPPPSSPPSQPETGRGCKPRQKPLTVKCCNTACCAFLSGDYANGCPAQMPLYHPRKWLNISELRDPHRSITVAIP